jgi:ribosomal protein L24E
MPDYPSTNTNISYFKVSVVQKLVNVAERKNPIRVAWTRTGEVQ